MGARQSYLYIYLKKKDKEYDEAGCKIKVTKTVVNGSIDFEVVTYTIQYNGNNPTKYDIYIYDSKETVSNGYYIFAYCSPTTNQVAHEVRVYYSVLSPQKPLVISFVTKSTNPYNCYIDKLRSARWNWASNITEYTFNDNLVTKLKEQYKKLLRNRTIELVEGKKESKDVIGYHQDIDEKTNYRIIYTPGADDSVLNSNCLFTFNTKYEGKYIGSKIQPGCKENPDKKGKNQIDPYYLTSVKGHFFDGIIVYFARDQEKKDNTPDENHDKSTALYLEFIDLRKKDVCFKRKDKAGCCWSEEKINYNNDETLLEELKKLKEEVNRNEENTIILDNKNGYNGVTVKPGEDKKAYKKYTYTFEKPNKTNLIFDRKPITIDSIEQSVQAKNVDAYYLKAKDAKEDDKEPFLIVFDPNGDGEKKEKKAYHFANEHKFKAWKEFKSEKPEELDKKLEEKLKEIEDNINCVYDLRLVRIMAHQIFIGEKPKPPEVKKEEKPQRPKVETPGSTTEALNLWLIIGCVVAGVVLLVALVVGYGVYWYNTTIKLLT